MGPSSPEALSNKQPWTCLSLTFLWQEKEMCSEKRSWLALQLGSSRGSWHFAHPKERVEFILGYEQLFFKASSFKKKICSLELNCSRSKQRHLVAIWVIAPSSSSTSLALLPECRLLFLSTGQISLSSLKNLPPGLTPTPPPHSCLPPLLISHRFYFQLCTQKRQDDGDLELMNRNRQGLRGESRGLISCEITRCYLQRKRKMLE